ncbi:MAG: histidine kinase [Paraglaciecola sp.]|uniref:sensor histidine kinase n=1 Tax=Paraglaciecola sp. TaxID=1920173 RepID=UPI003297179D
MSQPMNFVKLSNSLWKWQVIGWSLYFLLMFLTFLPRDSGESIAFIFLVKSFRTLVGFSLSCLLWLIYRNLMKCQTTSRTLLIVLTATSIFGIVWTALETLFFWLTLPSYDLMTSLQFKPRVALTYTVTLLAWSAIYFGIEYWKQVQVEHQNALHAKVLAETAQLDMLRYQVNPHFLFNALNSIRASINPDNPVPKQMITQLSEFLRHSLMSKNSNQNTLNQEFDALENYLAIEKIRFEEALEVEFHIDEAVKQIMVPCFILNPLVENAIKHGFQTSSEVLKIKVSALIVNNILVIEVRNTGSLNIDKAKQKTTIGLNNVQQRLKKQLANAGSFSLYEEAGEVVARIEILQS